MGQIYARGFHLHVTNGFRYITLRRAATEIETGQNDQATSFECHTRKKKSLDIFFPVRCGVHFEFCRSFICQNEIGTFY